MRIACIDKAAWLPKVAPLQKSRYETHFTALQAHPEKPAWLSRAHEHKRRSRHPGTTPSARSQAPPPQGRRSPLRPPHPGLIAAELELSLESSDGGCHAITFALGEIARERNELDFLFRRQVQIVG